MSSGRISLPREMDPKEKGTMDIVKSMETSSRLQSAKENTAVILNRLAEVSSSPPVSPLTPESPWGRKKRSSRRGSSGDNLNKLRDTGGLDSPTLMRHQQWGSSQLSIVNEHQAGEPSTDGTRNQGFMRKTASTPELKSVLKSSIASRRQQNPDLKNVGAKIVLSRPGSERQEHDSDVDASQPNSPMTPVRRHSEGGRDGELSIIKERRRSEGGCGRDEGRSITKDFINSRRRSSSVSDMASSVTSSIQSRRQSREALTTSWRQEMSDDVRMLMRVDDLRSQGVPSMTVEQFRENVYKVESDEPLDNSPKGELRHTKSYRRTVNRKQRAFDDELGITK